MKNVSGKLLSSRPINLAEASEIISGFSAIDNGASDAVRIFLRRTSDAFDSLVQLHKELKSPHSHRSKHASQLIDSDVKPDISAGTVENPEEKTQKRKKNRGLEPYEQEPLKIEGTENQKYEFSTKDEDAIIINQETNGVPRKKRKKKHMMEKPLTVAQSSDGTADIQVREVEHVKKEKMHYECATIEYDGSIEVGEGSVKRRKKEKRKRNEGEELGKSLEVEDGKNKEGFDDDDAKAVDFGKEDGKKKKKRRKTE